MNAGTFNAALDNVNNKSMNNSVWKAVLFYNNTEIKLIG